MAVVKPDLTPEEEKLLEFANSVKARRREKITLKDAVVAEILLDVFEEKREIKAYLADFKKGDVFICFGFAADAGEEEQETEEQEEPEDKQEICRRLNYTLLATDNARDTVSVKYEKRADWDEIVTVEFANGGYRKVNVSGDSGTAMIRDIMRNLGV